LIKCFHALDSDVLPLPIVTLIGGHPLAKIAVCQELIRLNKMKEFDIT
jgi:hypothetical protein